MKQKLNIAFAIAALLTGFSSVDGTLGDTEVEKVLIIVIALAALFVNRDLFTLKPKQKSANQQLLDLKTLFDVGILTKAEFDSKAEPLKKDILVSYNSINIYNKNIDEVIEKGLLDKANDTIRAANKRIENLKSELSKLAIELEEKKNKNVTCLADLTDFEVLGFAMTPNNSDLRKNYKSLSVIYHPDKSGSKRLMQRINNAYESVRIK
jgi:cell division protein FtsL